MKKVYFDDKLGDLLEIVSKRTYKYGITEKYIFFCIDQFEADAAMIKDGH